MSAPSVKRIESNKKEAPPPPPAKKAEKRVPPKKINCFVMVDKPAKPGLVLVSTGKVQDGCFVLGWQVQSSTWLVSEGTQWYAYAGKILKAQMAFTCIFGLGLLIVLYFSHHRGR